MISIHFLSISKKRQTFYNHFYNLTRSNRSQNILRYK